MRGLPSVGVAESRAYAVAKFLAVDPVKCWYLYSAANEVVQLNVVCMCAYVCLCVFVLCIYAFECAP